MGATAGDQIGAGVAGGRTGVVALSNGNYVVASPLWNNGEGSVGAATWGAGNGGIQGFVSADNSLIGSAVGDEIGFGGVAALSNGNYVVISPYWSNGSADSHFGAVTWGEGAVGAVGHVSSDNSLVGTTINDQVGSAGVAAVGDGNYVVASMMWNGGVTGTVGAVTWGRGEKGVTGAVSPRNSLIGTSEDDLVGNGGVIAFADGNYLVGSSEWKARTGAATLASGSYRLRGEIQGWNSALGKRPFSGDGMTSAYDAVRHRLMVGWPTDNLVSIFTRDQIMASDFD